MSDSTDTSNAELIERLRAQTKRHLLDSLRILFAEAADALAVADAETARLREAARIASDAISAADAAVKEHADAYGRDTLSLARQRNEFAERADLAEAALAQARRDALEEAAKRSLIDKEQRG